MLCSSKPQPALWSQASAESGKLPAFDWRGIADSSVPTARYMWSLKLNSLEQASFFIGYHRTGDSIESLEMLGREVGFEGGPVVVNFVQKNVGRIFRIATDVKLTAALLDLH
jgi:hypothetical protein